MQNQIGISSINLNGKLGSIFTIMVVVPPNFFRENHMVSDSEKLLNMIKNKLLHIWVEKIPPVDISLPTFDLERMEAKSIINSLNTYPKFWEHDINIEYSGDDLLDKIELPLGLRRVELNSSKWKINKNSVSKVCKLAKNIGQMYWNKELKDIKQIWGDFEDVDEFIRDNPENPHIRGN